VAIISRLTARRRKTRIGTVTNRVTAPASEQTVFKKAIFRNKPKDLKNNKIYFRLCLFIAQNRRPCHRRRICKI
jgi:hypothetical protein